MIDAVAPLKNGIAGVRSEANVIDDEVDDGKADDVILGKLDDTDENVDI